MSELDAEDTKLITLARSARARIGALEGAAVRDEMGRTYVATNVPLPALTLTAVQAALAMAVSGGAQGLEAVALVTEAGGLGPRDLAAIRDLGDPSTVILVADANGVLVERTNAG